MSTLGMASPSCWRCIIRTSVSLVYGIGTSGRSRLPSSAILFSTSSAFGKSPLSKKSSRPDNSQVSIKGKLRRQLKKTVFVRTGRPPAPGERKAMRKRIVLSNANALEVRDLADMRTEFDSLTIGKVVGIPGEVVDQLRAAETFRTNQNWGLFRRPCILVREESAEMIRLMRDAEENQSTSPVVLDGERGVGKSVMLLQAQAIGFLRRWIVITIPEAMELTMAMTEYSPIPGKQPRIYTQNVYIAKWLGQIATTNAQVLSKLKLSHQHSLPITLPEDVSLARLAELGARDPEISWPVFKAFWLEITSNGRPPVLMTLDGLNHIMKESDYRSPEYDLIHAHDLAVVKHFLDYLSGERKLPNGGAVMAATTKGSHNPSYALSLAIQQQEDRQAGNEVTPRDPWTKLDQRAYDSLQATAVMRLKGLNKAEARGLMEYWAASGLLRQRLDETIITERWAMAGNGIVGELERGSLNVSRI